MNACVAACHTCLPEPTLCAGHCSSCQGYTKEWKKKFLPPGHFYFIAIEKNKVGKKWHKEGQRWRVVREDLTEEVASEQRLKGCGGESPAGMGESVTGRGNGKGRDWGWETRGVHPVERKRGSGCSEVRGKMGEVGICHPLPVGHCQNSEFIPMRYEAMGGGLWPRSVLT